MMSMGMARYEVDGELAGHVTLLRPSWLCSGRPIYRTRFELTQSADADGVVVDLLTHDDSEDEGTDSCARSDETNSTDGTE